jgi:hypothetical protein
MSNEGISISSSQNMDWRIFKPMEFGPLNLVLTARCHAVPIAYLKAPPFEG